MTEEQINQLVKNVKDVKSAANDLEGKVRLRDKQVCSLFKYFLVEQLLIFIRMVALFHFS